MKTQLRFLLISALLGPGAVLAAGGGGGGGGGGAADSRPSDPVVERAMLATQREEWTTAQGLWKEVLARNPNDAEYHNLYAYSLRKGPNPDTSLVFKHYNEALRLDPKHRGANEYLGEAYLMVNNLPKAKEQLGVLDKLCFFPCKEYSDLKKSIADYEAKPR
jgi:tetratricopeptide (TPR) repeat protein